MEYKNINKLQFKDDEESGETIIVGYAATYGNTDNVNDVIIPGAFTKSLANSFKVKMLYQHNPSDVVGIWDDFYDDETGLLVKGRLADTPRGKEVATLLKMGAIDSFSIGYRTNDYSYNADGVRLLKEIDLKEISIVTFPANDSAIVTSVKKDNEDLASLANLTAQLIKLKNLA